MDDAARHDHELAVAAGAGEAEAVVALAQMCVAGPAALAGAAVAEALADDPVTEIDVVDALPDRLDDAAPFVARDARVPHPAAVEQPLGHVEVRAADARQPAAYQHFPWAARRLFHVAIGHLVRPVDHHRLHAA